MKRVKFVMALLTFAAAVHAQNSIKTSELDLVIDVINNSLLAAEQNINKSNIQIDKATITLKTVSNVSGGGGFKLFVKAS